ncbi:cation diffusion facilitator family transporter [Paenibacillus turpanensis]|uniref:cation diffusion facilitator family transporter n=1 Tax=Paenibacillus turpanensis TaxID=2689078 RepID=UPI00140B0D4F|nr:cation diffusion facilitator family transporter [Paenibacillus turpanensis]
MSEQRFAKAENAAWIGIVGNIILAAVKGFVGWMSGSKALIADAAHSASDVAGSFAVLLGLRAAKQPPDEDHPYGHGKAESIAAIIVSVLLLLVGIEIAISSLKSMYAGNLEAPKMYALLVIAGSIVIKEAMFRYKYNLGKKLSSQALIANAWEHRSDVYSSIAALIGVGGAVIGGFLGIPWLYYLDPVAGIVVAAMVLRMGYHLVKESIHNTMDHVLHEEDAKELVDEVQRVRGVMSVDELRAREHGHYVVVDVKISVNPRISVLEGHDIAKSVKHQLLDKFGHVSDVFIHVNPYDPDYPYKVTGADAEDDNHPTMLH